VESSAITELIDIGEAMMYESQLAALPRPSPSILKAFSQKMALKGDNGTTYPLLGGSCSDLLSNEADLVSLKRPEQEDRLTSFVQEHLAFMFRVSSRIHCVSSSANRN
jgi:hypothetical protein